MNTIHTYTIIAITENTPGVLYRIADVFLRRKINIDSLQVTEIGRSGKSQFTISIKIDASTVEKLIKQITSIIEVEEVFTR